MTLHEIEETLHTLQSRHSGLTEGMLVTLLRSGGWEEKNIQEAVLLFRSGGGVTAREARSIKEAEPLPPLETEALLPSQVDGDHLLLPHNEEVSEQMPQSVPVPQPTEPQSLIQTSSEPVRSKKDELPHNLPLRPFETSDHIWPFSRYKDVFFGEGETAPQAPPQEEKRVEVLPVQEVAKEEVKVEPSMIPPTPITPVIAEKKEEVTIEAPPIIPPPPVEKKQLAPVPFSRGDEKLVVMAAIMLVAILILLGYMYSNGRL